MYFINLIRERLLFEQLNFINPHNFTIRRERLAIRNETNLFGQLIKTFAEVSYLIGA